MGGPVRPHGGSTAVGLEFMSFHELGLIMSVDFSIMILISLAHIFPCLSLGCEFCTWFNQLLDEGSIMRVGVFTNLIIEEMNSFSTIAPGVLAEVILKDSWEFP